MNTSTQGGKSKEDVLKEMVESGYYKGSNVLWASDALKAMEEYAAIRAVAFLNSIRDYERESHNLIGFDDRTSEELYTSFLEDTK